MKQQKTITDRSPHLLEVDRLEKESLTQIFSGKVLATIVKDFYPQDLLEKFATIYLGFGSIELLPTVKAAVKKQIAAPLMISQSPKSYMRMVR
ncbi:MULTISPECIES: hypothetical protein [unclassified Chamaesiphon]|uniref:hypothetical protein n=1 Tax=unclassified Chamaesiphon TaxID=2620921 RepID=UPI00286CCBF3|nr:MULTISPECIES: hypothetical protein [unclassified Chamaesiphon]